MLPAAAGVAIWIALVSGSSVLFSLALACATPFAALATVSGLALRRGPALALVGTAWLANQAVGYGLLNYPRTPDSFAWGAAIGIAALAATVSVLALRRCRPASVIGWSAGFALAFAAYEGVLFAATAILPSGEGAFSPEIVGRILLVNVLALVGLAILHRTALVVRLLPAPAPRLAGA
jgi:hypothetical protein